MLRLSLPEVAVASERPCLGSIFLLFAIVALPVLVGRVVFVMPIVNKRTNPAKHV